MSRVETNGLISSKVDFHFFNRDKEINGALCVR